MKKILLFSRDPGGTNCIIPLVKPLIRKGYEVKVYAKDVAIERYNSCGIQSINLRDEILGQITTKKVKEFMQKENPHFIITATSADDMTEKYLWQAGNELKVKSFSILDQWINYGVRFSKYGVDKLDEFNKSQDKHRYLPTKICVMDEFCKQEMIKEGFKADKIIVTGQPHFENLNNKYNNSNNINQNEIKKFKESITYNESTFNILFASECLSKTYREKEKGDGNYFWGFTERTILINIINALVKIYSQNKKCDKVKIIIKQHPKEDVGSYDDLLDLAKEKGIDLVVLNHFNPNLMACNVNLVVGMSSMLLIESTILGVPIMSVMIGLKKENPFIFDRLGKIKTIISEENLKKSLEKVIFNKDFSDCMIKSNDIKNTGSIRCIINKMEEEMCKN